MVNRFPRLARGGALLLVVASALGWLWYCAVRRSDINFLPRRAPAKWIVYPSDPDATAHPQLETSTVFQRSFTLHQAPAGAALAIAGFHRYTLTINGAAPRPPLRTGRDWKEPDRFGVSRQLRPGENRIAVTVFNSNGPPALWLSLRSTELALTSDESWLASCAGSAGQTARLAAKPKVIARGSPLYASERPWPSLQARWPALLLFAVLSAAGYWLFRSRAATGGRWLVIGLAALWVALFVNNRGILPLSAGFDAPAHVDYIHYLQDHHALPQANEGFETHQPPLYYVLCAAVLEVLGLPVTGEGSLLVLRAIGLGICVAHLLIVWASLRLLFPGERAKHLGGLLLAGLLPPLLYLSQYVTNEGLAAALVSASLYLTLRILQRESVSWKACAGLGLCLGAALLTKLTAVLVVPLAFGALGWKEVQSLKSKVCGPWSVVRGLWSAAGRMGLILGVCAAVCGWYYLRMWAYNGPGFAWWQDDGFRTSAFYLRFGQALVNPWFGSFNSFADGIYCTLWGDGLFGGVGGAAVRPPWNYDFMAVGYWLALPLTGAVLVGGVLALARFLGRPRAEWLMVLGLGGLALFAMLHFSLVDPLAGNVKAFYGLAALIPFCACGALGWELLTRRSGKLRLALCVALGVWALTSYASFWIVRSSVPALLARSRALLEGQRYVELAAVLSSVLRLQPGDALAHHQLALALRATGRTREAIEQYTEVLRLDPESDGALNNLAWIRATHPQAEFRDGAEAVRLAERACRVDRYHEPMFMGTLAAAYAEAGRFAEAVVMATRARDRARELGQGALADKNEDLIRLFTARQPYREP
jgi:hypothetical protein